MKRLNVRIVLIQLIGMIFLINGIMQLRFYTVAEKIVCAKNHFQNQNLKCWKTFFPTKEAYLEFWPSVYVSIFLGLLFGILIVSFFNWKNKRSPLNTLLIAIIMYVLLKLKFFRREIIFRLLDPFWALFSDDFATQSLLEGIIFTCIGAFILYLSADPKLFHSNETVIES